MNDVDRYAHFSPIFHGIAHELRNPLQGIMASVAVLRSRLENDASSNSFLDLIQRAVEKMDQIINDLVELSRPITFQSVPCSLPSLVEEAIREIEKEALEREAKIQLDIGEKLPPIYSDADCLRKGILAVLRNAVESKVSGANVVVEVGRDEEKLVIRIHDNGEGIHPDCFGRIFEPFFSTKPKRAGLGLCIAERAVHGHNGHIKIDSGSGSGTNVSLIFPLVK